MGYYSTIKGSITFEPGITLAEAKESLLEQHVNSDKDTYLILEGFEDASKDELLNVISPRWEESIKVYTLIPELKELVKSLPDRTYRGYLLIEGEGYGDGQPDLWRLKVKDGKVFEVFPELIWPED